MVRRIASGWFLGLGVVILAACTSVDIKNEQRSDDEIQAVFDQNQSKLYDTYQGFLQKQGMFDAHIIFSLTIEPSGQVSGCSIHQSTLSDPALGVAICDKIRLFNFGPKNISSVSIKYPIDFLAK